MNEDDEDIMKMPITKINRQDDFEWHSWVRIRTEHEVVIENLQV